MTAKSLSVTETQKKLTRDLLRVKIKLMLVKDYHERRELQRQKNGLERLLSFYEDSTGRGGIEYR